MLESSAFAAQVSERQFQDTLIPYAQGLGWKVIHLRPARIRVGGKETYRTAVQGDGKGFPDNLMLRGMRCVVAELKRVGEKADADQMAWLGAFGAAGCESYIWTPADWPTIERILR